MNGIIIEFFVYGSEFRAGKFLSKCRFCQKKNYYAPSEIKNQGWFVRPMSLTSFA
jgi:hypothetical protein